ncbi:MAG: hypothetical protein DRN26_00180 [Thermoplasmata archaeon]|nr:MAG: hypothetical protein DRN26_00180 [Thermoplasmata archaeon]
MRGMTDREVVAHLRKWVKANHDVLAWPTDGCGYYQHLRYIRYRNDFLQKGGYFRSNDDHIKFVLEYADKLERGDIK